MAQYRPGTHTVAQQIKSLALSRKGSVFSRLRPEHLMSIADDIMAGNPETISEQALGDALLRREKAHPQAFMSDDALRQSPQTAPRSEVADSDIVKSMSASERLDFVNSNGRIVPHRFKAKITSAPSEYDDIQPLK